MSKGFSHAQHEPHDETLSQRLLVLPESMVPTGRVSYLADPALCFYFRFSQIIIISFKSKNSYADFINYARLKKNKTYICKPDSGCQGRGIFLTKNPFKDIRPGDNYVAQVYVSRVNK